MNAIADKKVKEALHRIKARRKDTWLQHMLNEVEKIDANIDDLHKTGTNLDALEDIFRTIDTRLNDEKAGDNVEVYKEIYSNLSTAIKEHMQILTTHAKEKIAEEMGEMEEV